MEEVHAISGKTKCMQLTMFVVGLEGLIFSLLNQYDVFKCESPLNFSSRSQGLQSLSEIKINCYILIIIKTGSTMCFVYEFQRNVI